MEATTPFAAVDAVMEQHRRVRAMSHVYYKFFSNLNYDAAAFNGPHISLRELKRQIMARKKLKATNCDLQVTNAQTKEGAGGGGRGVGSNKVTTGSCELCWAPAELFFCSCSSDNCLQTCVLDRAWHRRMLAKVLVARDSYG